MNKNEKNTVLVILFCLIGTYLLTFTNNFPYLGFAGFIIGLVFYVGYFKVAKDNFSKFILNSILVLAVFMVIRANGTVLFLNTLAIFYLGALVSLQFTKDFNFRVLEVLISPMVIFFDSLTHKNEVYDLKELKQGKFSVNTQKLQEILKGLAISLLVLTVILPLLSEANPFFSALIDINLPEFIEKLFGPNAIFKAIVFTFLMIFIPRLLSRINVAANTNVSLPTETQEARQISMLLPKLVTIATLTIFLITQLQLYLATDQILQNMGYTSAVKTREVFAQLAIVSAVILVMIFWDKSKEKLHQATSYLLALQTVFLIFVSLKSDLDNISNWGLTHVRLYGLIFIVWITGMLFMTLYNYQKSLAEGNLIRKAIILSVLLLVVVNTANFDGLIWKYGRYGTENGSDHQYLAMLSTDANSYKEQLNVLQVELTKIDKNNTDEVNNSYNVTDPTWTIVHQIRMLRAEYESRVPVRGFNLSRYLEFQNTKDINLDEVEGLLADFSEIYYENMQRELR